jgi:cancer susceptibility candidate protein 1
MGPESLNLGEFEVNLRRSKIVGGVFQIEYLEQPMQSMKTDEGALLRTCENKRIIL